MSDKKKVKSSNPFISMLKSNTGILCVMVLIGVILSFMTPSFLTTKNIISVLRQISNNIFLALGMTLVIILGGIDLSVGSIVAMSGTLTVGFIVTNGIPMLPAIMIGLALGTLVGLFNGVIVAWFQVPAFIVTLSTMNMAKGIAYIYSGGRSTRITSDAYSMIGTGYLFGIVPLPVVYMIILIIIFSVLLNKTKFGTYVYAVGGNRESARLSGVPIKKIEILVFTITGLLSAFAGIVLSSRMYSGQPKAGEGYEMDAIAACVLGGISMAGGVGHISGTVIGAIVIGIISNGLNLIGVSSFWQLLVKGMIILIAVIIDSQKDIISDRVGKRKKVSKA
ncbi:ABC transporter permease [Clostridium sp. C105KSO13]|uniref:ABC transporter permease n=1 Tax=Clostridium sp. C105KSO13 TaxID=1776045 RepID=UPI000740624D|nr:ABC transporter permease [Clostridium sp. C105KSO13]CUX36508.1 Ribose transport system permease protein RbsC [Clostridium sp. C105KSO13]